VNRLPAPYQQPNATTAGQPTHTPYTPATRPTNNAIELYDERPAVVYVPSAEDPRVMVAVPKQYVQPMQALPARDLTPQPLLDPMAQRMIGAGVGGGAFAAGVGYGVGQAMTGLAGVTSGGLFWLAVIILALKLPSAGRGTGGPTTFNTTHVHQKWLGKTNIHN
jgi:hypothetical protein